MKRVTEVLGVKIVGGLKETSTPWAGGSLLVDLFRHLKLGEAADKVLPAKGSSKGLRHGQMVESLVLLSALGGDCIDDMRRLRDDVGLTGILGYQAPPPETTRQWLDGFHDEALMAGRPLQGSFISPESKRVVGLKELNRRTIWAYVENLKPGSEVTLDVDAPTHRDQQSQCKCCYDGYRAFQPVEVSWAETIPVLQEKLRDGNAPACKDMKRVVDEAYAMLPPRTSHLELRIDLIASCPDVCPPQ